MCGVSDQRNMIKKLLLERLCALYSQQEVQEALELPQGMGWLKDTTEVARHSYRRGPKYHRGRVRYFVDLLVSGHPLDPIEVGSDLPLKGVRITPVVFIVDGHHRFLAHCYVKAQHILAEYKGRPDVLRYLEGKRKTCPKT